MANTSNTYVGDGVTRKFAITFPYIAQAHVKVELNTINRLNPSDWVFFSATEIEFVVAPAQDAGVKVFRQTAGDTRLVNFQDGTVLTEADLDLSADQNFFLAQEAKENYSELVNNELVRIATALGINETDPDLIIASLVDTMLANQAAADLMQALGDIAANGQSILDNSDLLQLIGDSNPGRTAFILDETTIEVDGGGTTLASKFSAIVATGAGNAAGIITEQTARIAGDAAEATARAAVEARVTTAESDIDTAEGDIVTNAAAVVTEQTARISGDGAIASDIALIGAANGGDTAFIMDTNTVKITSDAGDTFNTILARHAVAIDVNGYITGYELINDGTESAFSILSDKFQVVTPTIVWAASTAYVVGDIRRPTTPTSPKRVFRCTTAGTSDSSEPSWDTTIGNTTNDNTVVWTTQDDAALVPFTVQNGIVFADTLVTREVRFGQTAFNTGVGYFLGDVGGTAKFSIGNPAANSLTWDGTALAIAGSIDLKNTENSFTMTYVGFSTVPASKTWYYINLGAVIMLYTKQTQTGTSNSVLFSLSGIPVGARPTVGRFFPTLVSDNGAIKNGRIWIKTDGTAVVYIDQVSGSDIVPTISAFTASGTKGFNQGTMLVYAA